MRKVLISPTAHLGYDNPPQFEQTLVKVSKPEELYPPFEIAKVYAFDPDTGNNGKIKYELLDDNNGMFRFMTNIIIYNTYKY